MLKSSRICIKVSAVAEGTFISTCRHASGDKGHIPPFRRWSTWKSPFPSGKALGIGQLLSRAASLNWGHSRWADKNQHLILGWNLPSCPAASSRSKEVLPMATSSPLSALSPFFPACQQGSYLSTPLARRKWTQKALNIQRNFAALITTVVFKLPVDH